MRRPAGRALKHKGSWEFFENFASFYAYDFLENFEMVLVCKNFVVLRAWIAWVLIERVNEIANMKMNQKFNHVLRQESKFENLPNFVAFLPFSFFAWI